VRFRASSHSVGNRDCRTNERERSIYRPQLPKTSLMTLRRVDALHRGERDEWIDCQDGRISGQRPHRKRPSGHQPRRPGADLSPRPGRSRGLERRCRRRRKPDDRSHVDLGRSFRHTNCARQMHAERGAIPSWRGRVRSSAALRSSTTALRFARASGTPRAREPGESIAASRRAPPTLARSSSGSRERPCPSVLAGIKTGG
jgi:hypothetical protein